MPWTVQYNEMLRCIETTYDGIVSGEQLIEAATATIALGAHENTKLFLGDCTHLVGGHTISDLFFIMEQLMKLGFPRGGREAVLYPTIEERARDVEFWETICLNRGFQVRAFDDRETAIRWLTGRDVDARGA